MKLNFKSYLFLFLLGWVVNSYEVKAGSSNRHVAPVEAVPYPTGAGTVYADGSKSWKSGLIPKYQSIGASKGWSTNTSSFKGTFNAYCVPKANWFFIGWTEDEHWEEGKTFISKEKGSSSNKVTLSNDVTSYETDVSSSGTYSDNDQGVKCVTWMNNNKDKCKFCYGNFARVISSTDSQDGTTTYSPLVNNDGDVVTITATPNSSDTQFSHWRRLDSSGNLLDENASTLSNYTFTISSENYGEYVAVFQTVQYPDNGTYIFKNVGTGLYASNGSDVLSPSANREKDFCTTYSIEVDETGELTVFLSGTTDVYYYRNDIISFINGILSSLGVTNHDASDFVNAASKIHLESKAGGYAAYHQIPELSSNVSGVTTWNDIKTAINSSLSESTLTPNEQKFLSSVISQIEPGEKYYLTASTDGSSIYYTTEGPSDYALWNQEVSQSTYLTNSSGWCHLKNIGTNQYTGFIGNVFNISANPDFSNLATMVSSEEGLSNPCNVFFVKNSGNMSDLYAQGYGIRNQVNDWLTFDDTDGTLKISAWGTAYLYADGNELKGTTNKNESNSSWALEPLTESSIDKYYFGAKCNSKYTDGKGHYYTTMYTCFPYKCMDGVKAYYVNEAGIDLENKRITCTEIESGKVPANTAVILECNGLSPKENRLVPIACSYNYNTNVLTCSDTSVGTITDNVLIGTYFNHGDNVTPYTRNSDGSVRYLVFSISNGLLGFYKHNTMEYLSANKAYLDMNRLESAGIKSISGYTLAFETNNDEATSIIETSQKADVTPKGVYNMMGVKVGENIDDETLPKGIYIVNGQKYLKR